MVFNIKYIYNHVGAASNVFGGNRLARELAVIQYFLSAIEIRLALSEGNISKRMGGKQSRSK